MILRRVPIVLSVLLTTAAAASADDVYLTNGRSFEGVVAEVTETQVKIRMPGGELSLSRSQVARIESEDSPFAEYLSRKEAIRKSGNATAWLELALWAQKHGLAQGIREAALKAAVLEPQLEGLAPLMRGAGYSFDAGLGRWIPYDEAMRRKGLVLSNGEWIPREQYQARQRAQEEIASRRAAERADAVARQRHDAVLRLAEAQLYKEALRTAPAPPAYTAPLYVFPGYFYVPPVVPSPPHHPNGPNGPNGPGGQGGGHRPPSRNGYNSFIGLQPGSLLPPDYQPISRRP
jgi:hypothetical protein